MATFKLGKSCVVKVDDSGLVARDISQFTDEVTIDIPAEMVETTAFGAVARSYVTGLKGESKFTMKGSWDSATTNGIDVVLSGIVGLPSSTGFVTVDVTPGGGAPSVTNPHYTAECICTSYVVTTPVAGVIAWTAEFISGDGNGIARQTS